MSHRRKCGSPRKAWRARRGRREKKGTQNSFPQKILGALCVLCGTQHPACQCLGRREGRAFPNPSPAGCSPGEPCLWRDSCRPARGQRQPPQSRHGAGHYEIPRLRTFALAPAGEQRRPAGRIPVPHRAILPHPSAGSLCRPRGRPLMGTLLRPHLPPRLPL